MSATAVQHALQGVAQLHREGTAIALALNELDSALLADAAITKALDLINTAGEAAGSAAGQFKAASRILTDNTDAEGHVIASDSESDAIAAHEIRRELAAVSKRIEEINAILGAVKNRLQTQGGRVQGLHERGNQYAHRIAQ